VVGPSKSRVASSVSSYIKAECRLHRSLSVSPNILYFAV
jgi:hypothetical protein